MFQHKESQNYDQKDNTLALLVKCYEKLNQPSGKIVLTFLDINQYKIGYFLQMINA